MENTVVFEEKYKTNINKFSSTDQITDFLEEKLHRPLEVVSLIKIWLVTEAMFFL